MSRLGEFAKRYEQVQRGLQGMAERQLVVHRQSEVAIRDDLATLAQRKRTLQTTMLGLKTGVDWQVAWSQLRVLEAEERDLQAALVECKQRISDSTLEVTARYQEAERWDTLATREEDREQADSLRRTMQVGDDLAVQAHGRAPS